MSSMLDTTAFTQPIPQAICILSPVKVRESTFLRLGELQLRQIRIVNGDYPEDKVGHDFDGTSYVAQLSLHLADCNEIIQLPLLALKDDISPAFSYTLYIDLQVGSDLLNQVEPYLSLHREHETLQCDIMVYELIATAMTTEFTFPSRAKSKTQRSAPILTPIACPSETSLLTVSDTEEAHLRAERKEGRGLAPHDDDEDSSASDSRSEDAEGKRKPSFDSLFKAPSSPGKQFVRKLSKSVRKLTGRHQRHRSNPQLRFSTMTADYNIWDTIAHAGLKSSASETFEVSRQMPVASKHAGNMAMSPVTTT